MSPANAVDSRASPTKRYLAFACVVFAGEAIFSLPFHVARFFRPTFLSAFGLTNAQVGDAYAVYGLTAMLAYFPGGLLADRFGARAMMAAALFGTALGGIYLATLPVVSGLGPLYGYWGVTTILMFWSAMIRFAREWGGPPAQGRSFGLLDGGRGLVAAALATLALPLVGGSLDATLGDANASRTVIRQVIVFYTVVTALAGLLCLWAVPRARGPGANRKGGETTPVRLVLRQPVVWLQALIVVAAYCGYKAIDYYTLYAADVLGLDAVHAEQFVAAAAWLRPVAAVAAGIAADRVGSARRIIIALFAIGACVYGLLAALGAARGMLVLLYPSIVLSAGIVYALRGVYFALIEETSLPATRTGAAAGLISVVGFLPDVFFAPLAGRLLDNAPGAPGQQQLFVILGAIFFAGMLAALAVRRRRAGNILSN